MLKNLGKLGSIISRLLEYTGTPIGEGYSIYVCPSGCAYAIVEYNRKETTERPGGGLPAFYRFLGAVTSTPASVGVSWSSPR
jgi:hypothetical protein